MTMVEFIVMAIIFGILVGGFLGGMATADCRTLWGRILGIIIWIVICGCSISGMIMAQKQGDRDAWNNGACPCGSAWELVNIQHSGNSGKLYYYTCRECNNIITLHGQGIIKE